MEAYLAATKPGPALATRAASLKPTSASTSSSSSHRAGSVNPAQGKARPYGSLTDAPKAPTSLTSKNLVQGGLRDRNRAILNTLGKDDNPITNSTAYSRTMHIQVRSLGPHIGSLCVLRLTPVFVLAGSIRAAQPVINPAEEGNGGPCTGTRNLDCKLPKQRRWFSKE